MNAEELKVAAMQMAALTHALDERSRHAVSEVTQSNDQLQRTAKSLGLQVQRIADEAVNAIGMQARDAIHQGLQQAISQCSVQLQQAAQQAMQSSANLRDQGMALQRAQRSLVWKCAIALLLGSLLAAGGAGAMIWTSWDAVRQAQFSTAVVRATGAGTLTQCDGVLCVKANKNAARYEKNGDYILLKE